MVEVVWTRRAENDLLRLFATLEDHRPGAGDKLLAMVDAGLDLLREFPEMAPVYDSPIRRLVLRIPRYGLFFSIESNRLIIHAIADLTQSVETIVRHLKS